MSGWISFLVCGFLAQSFDAFAGMGYGLSANALLLSLGNAPAQASAVVHGAEFFTTFSAAIAHAKMRSIKASLVIALAVPGVVGGFLGALGLANFCCPTLGLSVSALLCLLGVGLIFGFPVGRGQRSAKGAPKPQRNFLIPLGFIAGFLDALGGGGWGPVTMPLLVGVFNVPFRLAVGSVCFAEFFVTSAINLGFLFALGGNGVIFPTKGCLYLALGGVLGSCLSALMLSRFSLQPHSGRRVLGVVTVILHSQRVLAILG